MALDEDDNALTPAPAARRRVDCRPLLMAAAASLTAVFAADAAEDPLATRPATTTNIVTHALAATPADCAARYHARLGRDVLPKTRMTQTVADEMRVEVPAMPGYWQFWDGNGITARNAYQQRQLAVQLINRAANRMCARSILARGGRIRCLKWKPIPEGYQPPPVVVPKVDPTKLEVSAAERRIAAGVARRVMAKGAFRELAHGHAFYHMAQRTTDELIAYARQPQRETLCTGAKELIGFYRRQLEPLTRKVAQAKQLQSETQTAARLTIRAALFETGKAAASDPPDYTAAIRALLRPSLDRSDYATLTTTDAPFEVLTQARDVMSDQRFEAMAKQKRARLRKALRNIEFALYADYNARHLRRLSDAFDTTFDAVLDAHARACTCKQP